MEFIKCINILLKHVAKKLNVNKRQQKVNAIFWLP